MKKRVKSFLCALADRPRRHLLLLSLGGIAVLTAAFLLFRQDTVPLALPSQSVALQAAAKGLDEITITGDFDPEESRLTARQVLRLQNRTGGARNDVVLRTYPNAFSSEDYSPAAIEDTYDACYPKGFSPGSIAFSKVSLNGADADWSFSDEAKTALSIPVPSYWQDGEWIEITLEYTITIPDCAYRFGQASGIWTLGNAFPIPSVWEDDAWRTDEYYPIGDPFISSCANYHVTLTVPRGYTCAASAYGEKTEAEGKWTYAFDAPAVRDFALSLSNRFFLSQDMAGGVLVSSYALTARGAAEALKYAQQALNCFSRRFGAYPYQQLAVAAVDFPYSGMEYPGLILVQKALYDQSGTQDMELAVAHEAAHQWWYAVVGSDEFYQPWQDEALAEFSLLDYVEDYYGQDARDNLAYTRFETAMRATVPEGVTPGSPIDYFGDDSEYSQVVYRRGASLMVALNLDMGDKFEEFLRTYYKEYAFRIASRADFTNTLKAVSGRDLSALMVDYLDTYIVN